jgi:streptogramin lyase
MKLRQLAPVLLATGLSVPPLAHAATQVRFIDLGPQVTSNAYQASAFTKDSAGNDLLCAVIRSQPAAKLLIFDLKSSRLVHSFPMPGANGAWGAVTAADGSVYLATENNGKLFRYLPKENQIRDLGRALPDQTFLWNLTRGDGNSIFGCTYPGCRVFRYDPTTGFSDLTGAPIVPGEQYARTLAYDAETSTLYVGVGVRPHLIEINLKTKQQRDILPPEFHTAQTAYSLSLVGPRLFVMLHPQERTIVLNCQTLQVETSFDTTGLYQLTSPASPYDGSVYYVHEGSLMHFVSGKPNEKILACSEPLAFTWLKFDESELVIFNKSGQLIRYHPPTGRSIIRQLRAPEEPARIQSIFPGPDNRMWMGGYLAGAIVAFDPTTRKTAQLKGFTQAESGSPLGRTMYFGVYPHCQFYAFDTAQPCNLANNNPKKIGELLAHNQSRPVATLAVESLNKVFIANIPEYGALGGGLGIYDATADRLTCHENLITDQSIVSLLYCPDLLVGGTSISGGLGIKPTQTQAKLFLYDPTNGKIIFETVPVPGKPIVSGLTLGPDGHVWAIAAGTLFAFDLQSRQVLFRKELFPLDYSDKTLWRDAYMVCHKDGHLYATEAGRFFRIDPVTQSVTILKETGPDLLSTDASGNLYFAQGTNLWQYVP